MNTLYIYSEKELAEWVLENSLEDFIIYNNKTDHGLFPVFKILLGEDCKPSINCESSYNGKKENLSYT